MKVYSANQSEAMILFDGESHFIRVYDNNDKSLFKDYLIFHPDLSITINDSDAYFYERDDGECWIDLSEQSLGKDQPE